MSNRSGSPYSTPRDANRVPVLIAASTADGVTPVVLEANPTTHQLQVSGATSYSLRMDTQATYTYIGEANPGTATSSASWRIKRLTNADNTIIWANGDAGFSNIWDNHGALSYS